MSNARARSELASFILSLKNAFAGVPPVLRVNYDSTVQGIAPSGPPSASPCRNSFFEAGPGGWHQFRMLVDTLPPTPAQFVENFLDTTWVGRNSGLPVTFGGTSFCAGTTTLVFLPSYNADESGYDQDGAGVPVVLGLYTDYYYAVPGPAYVQNETFDLQP